MHGVDRLTVVALDIERLRYRGHAVEWRSALVTAVLRGVDAERVATHVFRGARHHAAVHAFVHELELETRDVSLIAFTKHHLVREALALRHLVADLVPRFRDFFSRVVDARRHRVPRQREWRQ